MTLIPLSCLSRLERALLGVNILAASRGERRPGPQRRGRRRRHKHLNHKARRHDGSRRDLRAA